MRIERTLLKIVWHHLCTDRCLRPQTIRTTLTLELGVAEDEEVRECPGAGAGAGFTHPVVVVVVAKVAVEREEKRK